LGHCLAVVCGRAAAGGDPRGRHRRLQSADGGLEALAEPGGICVSPVVRDQVRDKLDFAFGDLGEQSVKNIARPVRVYRVDTKAADSPTRPAGGEEASGGLSERPSIAVLGSPT
jgi:class 3 adenylate cyclase